MRRWLRKKEGSAEGSRGIRGEKNGKEGPATCRKRRRKRSTGGRRRRKIKKRRTGQEPRNKDKEAGKEKKKIKRAKPESLAPTDHDPVKSGKK